MDAGIVHCHSIIDGLPKEIRARRYGRNGGRHSPLFFVEVTWIEGCCDHWGSGWVKHPTIGSGGSPSLRKGCIIALRAGGSSIRFNAKADDLEGSADSNLEAWWS